MKKIVPLALAILSPFMVQSLSASTLWQEEFDYPDGTLTNVTYPTWTSFSGSGNFIQVVGGEALVGGFASSADDSRRSVGGSITTGALYLGALVKLTAPPTTANGEYFLSFYNSPSSGGGYIGRIFASTTDTGWTFGLANAGSAPTDWSTDLALDTYYKIIAKLDLATKTAVMGVFSPSYEPLSDGELTLTGGAASTIAAVDYIALRQAGTAQGSQVLDAIWLGTELSDVAPLAVPEPSVLALVGGFGLLALTFFRRRQ